MQVEAVNAFRDFVEQLAEAGRLVDKLEPILQDLLRHFFQMASHVEAMDVIMAVDTIIERVGEAIQPCRAVCARGVRLKAVSLLVCCQERASPGRTAGALLVACRYFDVVDDCDAAVACASVFIPATALPCDYQLMRALCRCHSVVPRDPRVSDILQLCTCPMNTEFKAPRHVYAASWLQFFISDSCILDWR